MNVLKRLIVIIVVAFIILFSSQWVIEEFLFPFKYKADVVKYSEENNIDPRLVLSIIKVESNFKEDAISKKGALGLMQMTAETGSWVAKQLNISGFRGEMLLKPETNIKFGCWYLNNLNEEFNDLDLVLAAYNGGRGNVKKWLSDEDHSMDGKRLHNIPFKETDKYVKKVKTYYNIYKRLYKEEDFNSN